MSVIYKKKWHCSSCFVQLIRSLSRSWTVVSEYRVSSETVYTCSLFVNCASHASLTIKKSIYFFSWIKIDAENGITLKN